MNKFTPKILIGVIVVLLLVVGGFIFVSTRDVELRTDDIRGDITQTQDPINSSEYYDGSGSANVPSPTPLPSPVSLSEYIYPGSQRSASGSAEIELSSKDTVTKITDWYKNKISELGFNAQSTATSEVNGEVFNKISAAKPGEKIEVTIKKDQNTSNVLITVDRL